MDGARLRAAFVDLSLLALLFFRCVQGNLLGVRASLTKEGRVPETEVGLNSVCFIRTPRTESPNPKTQSENPNPAAKPYSRLGLRALKPPKPVRFRVCSS